ncbi:MAG: glycosyltransferase family 39 protein, partial [Anaerolineae bacterium]|nr:glycosyltransferase family 39 protein [Anaerolineae bacterium]
MRYHRLLIACLLLGLFARLVFDARQLSLTSDEPSHIASGYALLAEQATWTVALRGHPLLVDAWIALPVFLGDPAIPVTELDGWQSDNTRFVQAFVPYLRSYVARTEIAARLPVMLLTIILAAVTARWARDLGGPTGATAALIVLMCDPIVLGHGMLATNDVGVTALGTAGLYVVYRHLRNPKLSRLIVAGLVLGAAALAKGSGIIWLFSALLMIAGNAVLRRRGWRHLTRAALHELIVMIAALAGIWAFYGFTSTSVSILGYSIPLPAGTHWNGVLMQSTGAGERWTYFLGQVRRGGTWTYFPVAALLKNPVPLLALVAWGARRQLRTPSRKRALIWVFPVVYIAVAGLTAVNIGYRHMIPVHPFAYLLVAGLPLTTRLRRYAVSALVVALAIESALTSPYHLSYFSPVAGGPHEGWRYLADSNTDWGQGYKTLKAYQTQRAAGTVAFSGPEGYIGLSTYGIDYTPLPPIPSNPEPIWQPWMQPSPGTYVISANTLSGLGLIAPDNYAWFRYHQPIDVIADILFVYEIASPTSTTDGMDGTWLAQCSAPVTPLDAGTIQAGFGEAPSRILAFDCTQSWVYPTRSAGKGWYAIHDQLTEQDRSLRHRLGLAPPALQNTLPARHLGDLQVSYRQWDYRETPAYLIYESQSEAIPRPELTSVRIATAGTPPNQVPVSKLPPDGIDLGGPIAFLGVAAYPSGDGLEIETWWRRRPGDISTPVSIMAHLVAGDGRQIAVA